MATYQPARYGERWEWRDGEFRCDWRVNYDGGMYPCLLLPHSGHTHKIMDDKGRILSLRVDPYMRRSRA